MGWTFCNDWRSRDAAVAETRDYCARGGKVLLGEGWTTFHGDHVHWFVVEGSRAAGASFDGRLIGCSLVQNSPHGWGRKDMDETVGPVADNIPRELFLLAERRPADVATGSKFARDWRDRVRLRLGLPTERQRDLYDPARVPFDPREVGGAFDGNTVTSDADSGL